MASHRRVLPPLTVLLLLGGVAATPSSAAAPAPMPTAAANTSSTCNYYAGDGPVEPGKTYPDRRVLEVQCLINTNTSYLPPLAMDGIYGPRTSYAVTVVQQHAGLPATGIVNRATWAALRAGVWW
ncbi:peptidoglycan-binding domain-containing protein [Streptomyces sp. NPDC046197]|uniref:peptidoglycan-binding domain-containing protein n=1 Tax=Streptomyces sp. NPDC046197 TaxID=3154337 RepID=UPI0033DC37B7